FKHIRCALAARVAPRALAARVSARSCSRAGFVPLLWSLRPVLVAMSMPCLTYRCAELFPYVTMQHP
ncbi:hypothetical protein TorRG33x02_041170, partial [Trema orientale]